MGMSKHIDSGAAQPTERHIHLNADGMARWCSDDEYADDYRRSVRRQAQRKAAASGRTVLDAAT
jgi:hypothetical protein